MKKIIAGALIALTLVTPLNAEPEIPANLYPAFGLVTSITETDFCYEIVITDMCGFSYAFYSEDGDFQNGDGIAVIMNDMNTININDDQIVGKPRYVGHIEFLNQIPYDDLLNGISEVTADELTCE